MTGEHLILLSQVVVHWEGKESSPVTIQDTKCATRRWRENKTASYCKTMSGNAIIILGSILWATQRRCGSTVVYQSCCHRRPYPYPTPAFAEELMLIGPAHIGLEVINSIFLDLPTLRLTSPRRSCFIHLKQEPKQGGDYLPSLADWVSARKLVQFYNVAVLRTTFL